jgi:hypothetical protein
LSGASRKRCFNFEWERYKLPAEPMSFELGLTQVELS